MYLLWTPRPRKEQAWVEAGRVTQLELDTPTEVVFRKNRVDGWRVTSQKSIALVVKQSDNDIVAFSPRCPHLGCAVHWVAKQNEFFCPCHASTFSIEGQVLSGPAQRSLDRLRPKWKETNSCWDASISQGRQPYEGAAVGASVVYCWSLILISL